MKSTTTSIRARLRLPGAALAAAPAHDTVTPPRNSLRRILTCLVPALAALALARPAAQAADAIIYQDSFNRDGALSGSTPDTTTGGAMWSGGGTTATTAGGQLLVAGNANLPFTPSAGHVYTLSFDLYALPATTDENIYVNIGAAGNGQDSGADGMWMEFRTNGGAPTLQVAGNNPDAPYVPFTAGNVDSYQLVLDTKTDPLNWTTTPYVNGTQIRFTRELGAAPIIDAINVGVGGGPSSGVMTNFQLAVLSDTPLTFPLTITAAVSPATGFVLKWASQAGMLYDVLSTGDVSEDLADWDVVNAGIDATPDENTWPVTPVEAILFYRVQEYPVPPVTVFSEDFEGESTLSLLGWDTGAYLADTATTTWDLGTPSIVGPVPPGVPLPSASNCVGTNLAAIYGISSDIWLRTPAIDLTGKTGAKVVFQQWVDIDPYRDGAIGDMGTVRVLDADDLPAVTELAVAAPDMDLNPAGWVELSADIPDGLGNIVVEFRFESDNDNTLDASGWYIDDVKVTVAP